MKLFNKENNLDTKVDRLYGNISTWKDMVAVFEYGKRVVKMTIERYTVLQPTKFSIKNVCDFASEICWYPFNLVKWSKTFGPGTWNYSSHNVSTSL